MPGTIAIYKGHLYVIDKCPAPICRCSVIVSTLKKAILIRILTATLNSIHKEEDLVQIQACDTNLTIAAIVIKIKTDMHEMVETSQGRYR